MKPDAERGFLANIPAGDRDCLECGGSGDGG
jgi:hypothetical protein